MHESLTIIIYVSRPNHPCNSPHRDKCCTVETYFASVYIRSKALVLLHSDLTQCAIAYRVIWIRLVQSASPIESPGTCIRILVHVYRLNDIGTQIALCVQYSFLSSRCAVQISHVSLPTCRMCSRKAPHVDYYLYCTALCAYMHLRPCGCN